MREWLESPGHRVNLLSRDVTPLGCAARLVRVPVGPPRVSAVQVFARLKAGRGSWSPATEAAGLAMELEHGPSAEQAPFHGPSRRRAPSSESTRFAGFVGTKALIFSAGSAGCFYCPV